MSVIELVGVCGTALDHAASQILARCPTVVTGQRHRFLLAGHRGRHIPMTPLAVMLRQVEAALQGGDVCILASGDPLFFGIGRTLLQRFRPEQLRVHPALSAVQLACARFRVPWDDMAFCSLHGRSDADLPGRILRYPKVMLFTDPMHTPDRVAAALLQYLEEIGARKQIDSLRVRVAENLGLEGERIRQGGLAEIAATTFSPLNLMLLEQPLPRLPDYRFGLVEGDLAHSRGLITKNEVRAAILHALRLPEPGVLWDVGGGSGSISVEAARLCPGLAIHCVEQRQEEQANIRRNIRQYRTANVWLHPGSAPELLAGLPDPDRVFIGGSGGRLAAIVAACTTRLRSGGRIVISAVLEETGFQAPRLLVHAGLRVRRTRIAVHKWQEEDEEAEKMNPITLIIGDK